MFVKGWYTNYMSYTQKIIAFSTFLVLMTIIFIVPLALGGHHHTGVVTPMNSCPFMIGGTGLCGMSLVEYFSLWQSALSTSALVSAVITLCTFVYVSLFLKQALYKAVGFVRRIVDFGKSVPSHNLIGIVVSPRAP